jgi:hypothetical protein
MASNAPKRTAVQGTHRTNKRGKADIAAFSYQAPQSEDEEGPSTSASSNPLATLHVKHSAVAVDAAGGTKARTKYLSTQASPEKNPVPTPVHEWNTDLLHPPLDFVVYDASGPEPLDPSYVSFAGENSMVPQRKRKRPQSVSSFLFSADLSLTLHTVYVPLGTPCGRIPRRAFASRRAGRLHRRSVPSVSKRETDV